MSADELKGLWVRVDADRSGHATIEEFVGFMREVAATVAPAAPVAARAHDRTADSKVHAARAASSARGRRRASSKAAAVAQQ